jgi:hypothetical protein
VRHEIKAAGKPGSNRARVKTGREQRNARRETAWLSRVLVEHESYRELLFVVAYVHDFIAIYSGRRKK